MSMHIKPRAYFSWMGSNGPHMESDVQDIDADFLHSLPIRVLGLPELAF
jgi:hypothetical protein